MSDRFNRIRRLGTWVLPLASLALLGLYGCAEEEGEAETSSTAVDVVEVVEIVESPPRETALYILEAAADPLGQHVDDRYPASLERVLEERFLRVITSRNDFDFFIHDGERGGYQYEMVREFTAFLNERHLKERGALPIQFELVPVDDDQLIPLLLEGAGDLIAARLTITPERSARIQFSRPYQSVDELLVTHDGTAPLSSLDDLSGRRVAVREKSSYAASLGRLNRALSEGGRAPVEVVFVDEAIATEGILELVAARRYDYTIADSLVAELAVRIHSSLLLVETMALREDGKLAWATRPEATALLEEMNAFLRRYRAGSLLGNLAVQRYFETEGRLARRFAEAETGISAYDDLFREHAEAFDLDWRLVAAMAYQESRFDPMAHNRWGAIGLLQIKLKTAREPYVGIPEIEGAENVSNNIRAGLKYLNWIKARYFDGEPGMRERDRLRMAMAAYNAGPRAVIRARSRAKGQGLDPNRWFRHVELAMLGMRKSEPVKYVSEINQRYLSYLLLGIE
jgi:membrane-bound lytic murein transglycosylase MltF